MGGQHFELAADHGQRRAQLVRRIGYERALARERVGQAVEHVVERLGQDRHLVARFGGDVDARMQIAGVDARRHAGHPAQRSRDACADEVGREQRDGERDQPGEHERLGDAALRARDRCERLSRADDHAEAAGAREPCA